MAERQREREEGGDDSSLPPLPLRNHAKVYRRSLGRSGSPRDDKKGSVVCLSRLLMAVFGRVRNWRVCTRSLYTVLPPPFFLPLSLSFPSCNSSLPAFARRCTCRPPFSAGRRRLVPFSVVATFVPPASCVFSSSPTRRVAPRRAAPRPIPSRGVSPLLSFCHSRSSPFYSVAYSSRMLVRDSRGAGTEGLRFAETALCRGLRRWSFDASRSDCARLFPLALA